MKFKLTYTTTYYIKDTTVKTDPEQERKTFHQELNRCLSIGELLEGTTIIEGNVQVEQLDE